MVSDSGSSQAPCPLAVRGSSKQLYHAGEKDTKRQAGLLGFSKGVP